MSNNKLTTIDNINDMLENKMEKVGVAINDKPWTRLSKVSKLKKIYLFVDTILDKRENLTKEENKQLKLYLKNSLDRKNLQRSKDVLYIKETGLIQDIPNLIINKNNKHKFTLKNTDKQSSLKNLVPKKNITMKNKQN
jgi:hypothetical protein